jgi:hypothetical protein
VPTAGSGVTVVYDPSGRALASATNVNVHHGYNGANWTTVPGAAMAKSNAYWTYSYTIPMAATSIVMCFNDGATWENDGGNNRTFAVIPPACGAAQRIVLTNPTARRHPCPTPSPPTSSKHGRPT